MLTRSRENLHSIYILLFLNIAFFLLYTQDPQKYFALFCLDGPAIASGQYWRLFTYQFVQSSGLALFFDLLVLYVMGAPLEDLWGTRDFIIFYLLSLGATAGAGLLLSLNLLGSFFLMYSLLFAYAHMFAEQTFLLFFVIPVRVKWIAWFSLGVLLFGLIRLSLPHFAAVAGVIASFSFYWFRHGPGISALRRRRRPSLPLRPVPQETPVDDAGAEKNLGRFAEVRQVLESGTPDDREKLVESLQKSVVPGVNICPPADYKPLKEDRYCVRCEGFAECSIRYVRMNEPNTTQSATPGGETR